jgi:uncharacterized protein (DUF2336 family)
MALNNMDIQRLMQDPSPEVRAELASKIAETYHSGGMTDKEEAIAIEIIRILARDIEVMVRRTVALSLTDSLRAPHDLILRLANDVADVAAPILQYSSILSEEDLIEIVRSTREVVKLVHVAKRESISMSLSDALIETGEQKALHTLLLNKNAVISDDSLNRNWDTLSASQTLVETLVHRGGLSVKIAERLFSVVSDELKRHLARSYRLPMALVEDNIEDIREWTTLGMLMPDAANDPVTEEELERFVHQLYTSNRLTYSMVIRALCTGDLAFFEAAMARLAGVPRANARLLMFDSGPHGFKAFYDKAHMPSAFFDAIRVLMKLSLELTAYGRVKREDFRARMIERVREGGYDQSVDNMQYLLTVMGGHFAANATIH